jgi:hypothetical protein
LVAGAWCNGHIPLVDESCQQRTLSFSRKLKSLNLLVGGSLKFWVSMIWDLVQICKLKHKNSWGWLGDIHVDNSWGCKFEALLTHCASWFETCWDLKSTCKDTSYSLVGLPLDDPYSTLLISKSPRNWFKFFINVTPCTCLAASMRNTHIG